MTDLSFEKYKTYIPSRTHTKDAWATSNCCRALPSWLFVAWSSFLARASFYSAQRLKRTLRTNSSIALLFICKHCE